MTDNTTATATSTATPSQHQQQQHPQHDTQLHDTFSSITIHDTQDAVNSTHDTCTTQQQQQQQQHDHDDREKAKQSTVDSTSSLTSTSNSMTSTPTHSPVPVSIRYECYENEIQLEWMDKLIRVDLSEPYSIFTYRYFLHNWPELSILAMLHQND